MRTSTTSLLVLLAAGCMTAAVEDGTSQTMDFTIQNTGTTVCALQDLAID